MIRKLLLGAGALALMALMTGLGVGVGAGAASASGTPVTMTGPITCTVHGRYTFTTPLANGGTKQTEARIYLQLINCTGTGTKKGTVKVTSGILTASAAHRHPEQLRVDNGWQPVPDDARERNLDVDGGECGGDQGQDPTPWIYYNYNYNILVIGFPTSITAGRTFMRSRRLASCSRTVRAGTSPERAATGQPGLATFPFGQPKTGPWAA